MLRMLKSLLFVTLSVSYSNNNKNLHSLPEQVVGADINDCQSYVPSGGRLLSTYKVWKKNACHPRVVHILQWSYKIILWEPVRLMSVPIIQSGYSNREKHKFLQDCVTQMLNKKAIVPVRMCRTLGFYSGLFLVPKLGKKWRPVIDLSVLNNHLSVSTFKMETAEVIRNTICKGEWVLSIDLTDAYFHIPIHEKSQHQDFRWKGECTSSGPFHLVLLVVKEVKLMLQNRRICIHQYLDDWLLHAPSEEVCSEQSKQLVTFVQELGWVINQKSELKPTQNFEFLGSTWPKGTWHHSKRQFQWAGYI